jgi:hypothetical protein
MNFLQPHEIFEPLFTEFLTDQEAHLSPESHRQYAYIIDLLAFYQERHKPGRRRRKLGTTAQPDGTSCGRFAAEDLIGGFSKFLGDFLPHEIGVGAEKLRTARTVIKTLGGWLVAKGYVTGKTTAQETSGESLARPTDDPEASGPVP